ncbi:class I adenylate-forming enzyme family protein [Pradoshia sp.]
MTTSSLFASSQLLVGELLKRATHRSSTMDAFKYKEETLTFQELDQRASQLAAWLMSNQLKQEDKVGFLMKNSLAIVEVFFGTALSGHAGVPINFRLGAMELEYILNDSDCAVVYIDEEYADVIWGMKERLPKVRKVIVNGEVPEHMDFLAYSDLFEQEILYDPPSIHDDDPAMIVYTSGTTGRPKGAVLTHKNLCVNGFNMMWEGQASLHQIQLATVPLFHIAGIMILIRTVLVSGKTIIQKEYHPLAVLKAIEEHEVTTLALVPTMWNYLFQVPNVEQFDLSSVKSCTTGGAICPLKLKRLILKHFHNAFLIDTFGQTETTSSATVLKGEDVLRKTDSVGRAALNVELRVVDEEMNDVPIGEIGEIVYRGPSVMKEYYKNKTATEEAFKGGWFHSGDLVRMDEEGFIYVVDRKKDMLISGGENIYPAEVEAVLLTHPAVIDCAVIGIPDQVWGESVKAIVILKPGVSIKEEEVIEYCSGRLASYKKPKEVEFATELPRNASGKVLKQVLRKRALEDAGQV